MDKKLLELKQKVATLSQTSKAEPTAQQDTQPVPEIAPATVTPTAQQDIKPLPVAESTNELGLTPDEVRMFKEMMAKKEVPQETKEVETPLPVEEPSEPEPTQEEVEAMNEERMNQIQLEVTRLQNNGVYRAEILYQLVNLNSNLERIAQGLEAE